jgi:MATE family multidrug resistance protein
MNSNNSTSEDLGPSETTPLVNSSTEVNNEDIYDLRSLNLLDYGKQCSIIYRSSIPVFLGNIVEKTIAYSSFYFIGQYFTKYEIAAISLSSVFATITGWSLPLSMNNVLNTLCSQAFTGSNDIHMVGVYLQRGVLITVSMVFPISLIWWNSEAVFLLIKVDPHLAQVCATYLKVLLLGYIPYIVYDGLKRFMISQGITEAQSIINLIALPFHILFNYYLISNPSTRIGFIGAPLATVLSYWVMMTLGILYIAFINGYQAWGGWSKRCLQGWGPFVKMGLSSIVMTCGEWWAMQIVALCASYLGVLPLACYTILISINDLFWNFSYGISIISGNLVGNLIGESKVNQAIFAIRCSFITSLLCSIQNIILIVIFRRSLSTMFSSDPEIVEIVYSLLSLVIIYQIFDGLTVLGSGILRGQGRHSAGAKINTISYYLVSLPLSILLAFYFQFGLIGLYSALIITLIATSSSLVYCLITSNWQELILSCKIRLNDEN